MEACILTNQSSEPSSLPSVTEETDKETRQAEETYKETKEAEETYKETKQAEETNKETRHEEETGEDSMERKLSEISDKLVWDVLQKVKIDLEKDGGQGAKGKLTRNRGEIF